MRKYQLKSQQNNKKSRVFKSRLKLHPELMRIIKYIQTQIPGCLVCSMNVAFQHLTSQSLEIK